MGKRIFVAIKPTQDNLSGLLALQQLFREKVPKEKCRWIADENIHMTTHFIGNVEEAKIKTLRDCLRRIEGIYSHTQLLDRVVTFPTVDYARVLGVGSPVCRDELNNLYKKITQIINGLGLNVDKKPFYPHITLARFKNPLCVDIKGLSLKFEHKWINFRVTNYSLYESILSNAGARYEILEEFRLADTSSS